MALGTFAAAGWSSHQEEVTCVSKRAEAVYNSSARAIPSHVLAFAQPLQHWMLRSRRRKVSLPPSPDCQRLGTRLAIIACPVVVVPVMSPLSLMSKARAIGPVRPEPGSMRAL